MNQLTYNWILITASLFVFSIPLSESLPQRYVARQQLPLLESGAVGYGQATADEKVLGFSAANGESSAGASAASDDVSVLSNLISYGNGKMDDMETDEDENSPNNSGEPDDTLDAPMVIPQIFTAGVQRPVYPVPNYQNKNRQGHRSSDGRMQKKKPDASKPDQRPRTCWTLSKKCCFQEVHRGYKCKDHYEYNYARCHPIIKYEAVCGNIMEVPEHHPRPKGRVKTEETIIKNYDQNYGPHMKGYPKKGESEFYESNEIPQRPRGVAKNAYPPPPAQAPGSYPVEGGQQSGGNGNGKAIYPSHETTDGPYAATRPPTTARTMIVTSQSNRNNNKNRKMNENSKKHNAAKAYTMTTATGPYRVIVV